MSWATEYIKKLKEGETVTFRPHGRSMEPIVMSGQEVTCEPVSSGNGVSKGDVVLCVVRGSQYLHLVKRHDKKQNQFEIGNNKGRINGWVKPEHIYGRMVR